MAAPPAQTSGRSGGDPAFEGSGFDGEPSRRGGSRPLGWRFALLALAALLGGVAIAAYAHWVASVPFVDTRWDADRDGAPVLLGSPLPELQAQRGRRLVAIGRAEGGAPSAVAVDAVLLHRSPRWQVSDPQRARQIAQHQALAAMLSGGSVVLHFDDGTTVDVAARPRGWSGLGWWFWPLAALAWVVAMLAVAVTLARPRPLNGLFVAMAFSQAGKLLLIAMESTRGLGLPADVLVDGMAAHAGLDGLTGAAAVTAMALYPRRLPGAGWIAAAAWSLVIAWLALAQAGVLSPLWWWAQALALSLTVSTGLLAAVSYRTEPDPYVLLMQRYAGAATATLLLVTLAVALASSQPGLSHGAGVAASVAWTLFVVSLLLLTPMIARHRQWLRELALLAAVATVAISLDLLLVAALAMGDFAALAVSLFLTLALYAAARPALLQYLAGGSALGIERTFDLLYRAAREAQADPAHLPRLLARLLRELFEPLDVFHVDRVPQRSRVVGGGSSLVVPVRGDDETGGPAKALVLRYAQNGRRLFTVDDATLVDRVLEQMRRAVAYDKAVERGRNEERLRIAQDLHDDIGARLLTLMYQAPTPELEDYLRHTLQDLKTLTRGLATVEHRLSHAAVEWKADLVQRLSAAQAQLDWSFACDDDIRLTVVQWSALTRVLRELVSNSLYHGRASWLDVHLNLERGRLSLQVADDGCGRNPQDWAHGLGLGGVRKRVKAIGGEVRWREREPCGIVCDVFVASFSNSGSSRTGV